MNRRQQAADNNARWLRHRARDEAAAPLVTPALALVMIEIAIDEASQDSSRSGGHRHWGKYRTRANWLRAKKEGYG